jgi:hypothetical protein
MTSAGRWGGEEDATLAYDAGRLPAARGGYEKIAIDPIRAGQPTKHEIEGELGAQELEDVPDAGLTADRQPPVDGASDEDRARPEGERLQHVTTAPDAAVDEHLGTTGNGVHHSRQSVERGDGAVELATAMVGDDHRRRAVVDSK